MTGSDLEVTDFELVVDNGESDDDGITTNGRVTSLVLDSYALPVALAVVELDLDDDDDPDATTTTDRNGRFQYDTLFELG